jgi:ATP-dependent Lon protease
VGTPPGTGKTKFVKDYAHTLGREFRKIDLGGLNDPHELHGFHSTYLNSRPGHIINALAGCERTNPIILLDEIEKTGTGVPHQMGHTTLLSYTACSVSVCSN